MLTRNHALSLLTVFVTAKKITTYNPVIFLACGVK
jgi:hypothetical protein